MSICEKWWETPTINPRTNRKIKIDGPTYKALLKECGNPPPMKNPPKPNPPPMKTPPKPNPPPMKTPLKPNPPPMKTPPTQDKRISFLKLKEIYLSIMPENINKKTILLTYHPDKLPLELKEQINKYTNISKFTSRVFDSMKQQNVQFKEDIIKILDQERYALESPLVRPQPKPKPPSPLKKKTHIIYILGMGCLNEDAVRVAEYYRKLNKNAIINVECNESLKTIFKNIIKTACYLKPSKNNDFVLRIFDKINKLLNANKDVILMGHSYGGNVATILAELFNSHTNANKLKVATFGSIYITKPKKVTNIIIRQFMMLKDVALKCNKLKEPKDMIEDSYDDSKNYVTWIKNKFKDKWENHNNYDDIIYNIIRSENIMIPV